MYIVGVPKVIVHLRHVIKKMSEILLSRMKMILFIKPVEPEPKFDSGTDFWPFSSETEARISSQKNGSRSAPT